LAHRWFAGTWWPLILLPPRWLQYVALVIDPEERYLSKRFGSLCADYRAKVATWL
jgi:protein-S-isoprenylcysteine O-methyltransferase Ste14